MTGIELLKAPGTETGKIADIVSQPCPPVVPEVCDRFSCRECWLAWLVTGEPPKEKGPSDERTTPDEEGMHPNLKERYEQHFRQQKRIQQETDEILKGLRERQLPKQKQEPGNAY